MNFPTWRQLSPDDPRAAYKPSRSMVFDGHIEFMKGLHYGQRKLILSEIEYLSAVSDRCSSPLLVIYAGAANGSHLPFLFQLFPAIRFVLIDPAPFCTAVQELAGQASGPVVEIVEGYCTDELCMRLRREYASDYRLLLISDIRSGVPSKSTNKDHTAMILRDNAWQRGWCWALAADSAMLKFHPPYPRVQDPASPKFEEDDDTPSEITYLDGALLWGVWAPKSSSEVRLVVEGPFTSDACPRERKYDATVFEEQCYHYNTTARYQRDVDAERHILERYLSNGRGGFESAELLSKVLSDKLGFGCFCPLSHDQTEDVARMITLLYQSKNPADMELLPLLRHVTASDMVAMVAHRCRLPGSEVPPTFPQVPPYFWGRIASPKNLAEAYSFPQLRTVPNENTKPKDNSAAAGRRGQQQRGAFQQKSFKRPRESTQ